MLRVYSIPLSLDAYSYKYYEFHFNSNFVAAKLVGFSSSPGISLPFSNSCLGFISSKDDYYTTSQNITAMETTNNVFNEELYDEVRPTTVPTWIVYTTVISELLAFCDCLSYGKYTYGLAAFLRLLQQWYLQQSSTFFRLPATT